LTGVPPGSGSVQLTGGFYRLWWTPALCRRFGGRFARARFSRFTGRGIGLWLQCPLQSLNVFAHTGIAVELHRALKLRQRFGV
jgi:hypothetical protein